MARIEFAVIAQSFSIDRDSNALSIFNIIENLAIPKIVPEPVEGQQLAVSPPFAIVQRWVRTDPEIKEQLAARIQVVGPNGNVIGGGEFSVDLASDIRARQLMNFPFFPFAGVGDYKFITQIKVDEEWKNMLEVALVVTRLAV